VRQPGAAVIVRQTLQPHAPTCSPPPRAALHTPTGSLLRGGGKDKFKVPGEGAAFVKDAFIVALDDATTPADVQALIE
jgi:hypothetical protein